MKRIRATLGVLAIVISVIAGCGPAVYYTTEPIQRDPTWLKVEIINSSPYELHMEGVFEGTLEPYQARYANLTCRGTFKGVAHAYKEIGRSASGKYVEKAYMGENLFWVYTDGRNQMYNNESLDYVVTLSEGSFYIYPNVFGEKTHIFYQDPCSIGLLPSVEFHWGR